jgi:hypothetical protein
VILAHFPLFRKNVFFITFPLKVSWQQILLAIYYFHHFCNEINKSPVDLQVGKMPRVTFYCRLTIFRVTPSIPNWARQYGPVFTQMNLWVKKTIPGICCGILTKAAHYSPRRSKQNRRGGRGWGGHADIMRCKRIKEIGYLVGN